LKLEDDRVNRGYHSTAILLPDARVLSAGGEFGKDALHHDAMFHGTIFEPPYLFDPNISEGDGYAARPTIDYAPKFVGHGCTFAITVTASNGVSGVCLIRPGAVTHAFNQDQRYVPLTFTQDGSTVTVDGPLDARTAPPGDYMLFVLDNTSRKVPSVASWVRVTESIGPYHAADADRPVRIVNLNGSNGQDGPGCSQPINVTWSAPREDTLPLNSGGTRLRLALLHEPDLRQLLERVRRGGSGGMRADAVASGAGPERHGKRPWCWQLHLPDGEPGR
jgi:hypothetical protein